MQIDKEFNMEKENESFKEHEEFITSLMLIVREIIQNKYHKIDDVKTVFYVFIINILAHYISATREEYREEILEEIINLVKKAVKENEKNIVDIKENI